MKEKKTHRSDPYPGAAHCLCPCPDLAAGSGAVSAAGMRTVFALIAFLVMLVLEVLPVVMTSSISWSMEDDWT